MMSNSHRHVVGFCLGAAAGMVGCGSGGTGTLVVHASGEEAAEEGFPVDVGSEVLQFVDGWSLQFDAILLSVTDFELRDDHGDSAGLDVDPVVVDLRQGEPALWRFEGVPSGRWSDVRFRFGPTSDASRPVGPVDAALLSQMRDGGRAMWIEATATHGSDTVELVLGLPLSVLHARCENGVDGTDGVVVRSGGITGAEVTVHLDHLFVDSLADDGAMRFEPFAAMADEDGQVTLDALAGQSLTDLRDRNGGPIEEGGEPIFYDPGSSNLAAPNLREFVLAAASSMGHWNGEGHCDYVVE
jgi:hypothetical protein